MPRTGDETGAQDFDHLYKIRATPDCIAVKELICSYDITKP